MSNPLLAWVAVDTGCTGIPLYDQLYPYLQYLFLSCTHRSLSPSSQWACPIRFHGIDANCRTGPKSGSCCVTLSSKPTELCCFPRFCFHLGRNPRSLPSCRRPKASPQCSIPPTVHPIVERIPHRARGQNHGVSVVVPHSVCRNLER